MSPEISLLIPFFNEKESLEDLILLLMEQIRNSGKSFEVIFIDDASTDGGARIIKKHQERHSIIKLIQLEKRGGQTGCYKEGFKQVQGDYIIRMDADLQDDPRDLSKFLEKINLGSDLVVGIRKHRKHSVVLRWASGAFDFMVSKLFNLPFRYHTGSFVAFRANLMKDIPFRKNDHRYLQLIAIQRGAKNISQIIVRHNERRNGKSKYNIFTKIIFGIPQTISFLIRCKSGFYNLYNLK